jgi:Na+-driven multidrug efflux pump
MRYYFSGKSFLKIYLRNMAIQWDLLKEILAIGVASFSRMVATSISAIFVNRMLVLYGGDMAISAFGIIHRLMMFAIMPGIVIGGGLQPILGFNYGAKRYDRAMRAIIIAMGAAFACGLFVFGIVYFAPEPFVRIFTNDAELIALSSYAAKRIFLALYMIGLMMVGSLVFQSIGKVVQSFITSIAFPISDGFTLLLTLLLLIPQIRELRRKHRLSKGTLIEP